MITVLLTALALQLAAPAAPSSSVASPPSSSSPSPSPSTTTTATIKLDELRQDFGRLDCDRVVQQAPFVFEHRLATQVERHEAGFMHAYCAVVVGNLSEAEGLFSTIVGEDVAAQPPFEIEPRVRVLLEAARAEASKKLAAAAEAAKAEAIATIHLDIKAPVDLTGGARAFFDIEVQDPRRLVRALRLEFRRDGDMGFFALPVTKLPNGTWRAEIPGTYTRSQNGRTIEWFISVLGEDGAMLTSSPARSAPAKLVVAPGSALAQDLRANERLAHETRVALALLATPFLAGMGGLAGGALTIMVGFLDVGALTYLALAALPPVGAVLGASVVAVSVLDPGDASIVVLTTSLAGAAFAAVVLAGGAATATDAIADPETVAGLVLLGGGTAAIGLAATSLVSTVLVVLDAPSE